MPSHSHYRVFVIYNLPCVKLVQLCFTYCLIAYSMAGHHLRQWLIIDNYTRSNKFQWNFEQLTIICNDRNWTDFYARWEPFYLNVSVLIQGANTTYNIIWMGSAWSAGSKRRVICPSPEYRCQSTNHQRHVHILWDIIGTKWWLDLCVY